jgi:predicted solute-binding protein
MTTLPPELESMMQETDSALIIGDPALRIQPEQTPYHWLDLGAEWQNLTQLPMVFAAWAGKARLPVAELSEVTRGSFEFGKARLPEIAAAEYAQRGISHELAYQYLSHSIHYEIGPKEVSGLETFFELAGLTEGARL